MIAHHVVVKLVRRLQCNLREALILLRLALFACFGLAHRVFCGRLDLAAQPGARLVEELEPPEANHQHGREDGGRDPQPWDEGVNAQAGLHGRGRVQPLALEAVADLCARSDTRRKRAYVEKAKRVRNGERRERERLSRSVHSTHL